MVQHSTTLTSRLMGSYQINGFNEYIHNYIWMTWLTPLEAKSWYRFDFFPRNFVITNFYGKVITYQHFFWSMIFKKNKTKYISSWSEAIKFTTYSLTFSKYILGCLQTQHILCSDQEIDRADEINTCYTWIANNHQLSSSASLSIYNQNV